MSIRIDKITRARFGNKILQYNSLMQISTNLNLEPSCCDYTEQKFFKKNCGYKKSTKQIQDLSFDMVLNKESLDVNKFNYKIDDPNYLLHNVFFNVTKTNPRKFLELKDEYKVKLSNDKIHIGIHVRGGDRKRQNSRELHFEDYYIKAINHLLTIENNENIIFYICTDDNTFKVFKNIVTFLQNTNLHFKLSNDTKINKDDNDSRINYIDDFSILTECDYIIAGASTFPLTAYFLGKENKKLILSKKWIDKSRNHEKWGHNKMPKSFWLSFDNFWIGLADGKNKYLKAWLVI